MRRTISAVVVAGLLTAVPVVAIPPADASTGVESALRSGGRMGAGDSLTAANGDYAATLRRGGRLVLRNLHTGRQLWATPSAGRHARLVFTAQGQLVLRTSRGVAVWRSATRGSRARWLSVRDDGALTLTAGGLTVWTNRVGSDCPAAHGRAILVDIGDQRMRLCHSGQQLRTTPVTTGASALGYGTPTGTWHVYAKVRDTTLYPAAGGAYPVNYWMPYSGPYGLHDSPWQHFRYGSPRYRTDGSHGCVHVPGAAMTWLFGWAPVGTRVTVHA